MHLSLVIPGLHAPLPEWQRSYGWLPQAPGLQALLSGAEQTEERKADPLTTAAGLLGAGGMPASYRRLAQGLAADNAPWVCADPVHLRADVDSAALVDAGELGVQAEEAQALAGELCRAFGSDGWRFEIGDPARWYALPPPDFELPVLSDLYSAAGRDIGVQLRLGARGAGWKRFFTELQMVLAQSPVNRRREVDGMPPINALWFWGEAPFGVRDAPRVRGVQSDDEVLRGMARAAGLAARAPSLESALDEGVDLLVFLDSLWRPAAYDRIEAWQQAFAALETHWFAPLSRTLAKRRLQTVTLYADSYRWRAQPRTGLAMWRREVPLARSFGLEDRA